MNWSECVMISTILPGEESVVVVGSMRFTVLSERTLRMEYSPSGRFTDAPSQVFFRREGKKTEYRREIREGKLRLETDCLVLKCAAENREDFENTLSVKMKETGQVWNIGEAPNGNLGGTLQTLDNIDGAVPLPNGLLNRAGYTIFDDSNTVLLDEKGWPYEREQGSSDLYFFYYGTDYKCFLREYFMLSGKVPDIPRWTLGNWWSRFYPYTQDSLLELMDAFREREIPLSVCVIDMDWHIRENPYHEGWTGYTWNRNLIPEPERLIAGLHERGLKTALNLHPADGIAPFEDGYREMCRDIGQDADQDRVIPFRLDDRKFAESYFKHLHEPKEKIGVDFWWMDWQQDNTFSIPGLDTLWWINHLHYCDQLKHEGKIPVILSRWSGPGSHRYPIQFSGDTIVTWKSLAFQPYFTATAANVGCFWWSHDIGGHMGGVEDGELFLRWIQYGVFSPVLRLHSSDNEFQDRRPWNYGNDIFSLCREAMRLRHALIPYLYSEMYACTEGCPIAAPMYFYHREEEAYQVPQQYYFGRYLIAAPYTSPADRENMHSHQAVWLPEGLYYDFFTYKTYVGSKVHGIYGDKSHIPVFARAGSVIPMAEYVSFGDTEEPAQLLLKIFCGCSGSYLLKEGDMQDRETMFELFHENDIIQFSIHRRQEEKYRKREYHLLFIGVGKPELVTAENGTFAFRQEYQKEKAVLHLYVTMEKGQERLQLCLKAGTPEADPVSRKIMEVKEFLKSCRISNALKKHIYNCLSEWKPLCRESEKLSLELSGFIRDIRQLVPDTVLCGLLEILTGCGCIELCNTAQSNVLLWNAEDMEGFTYSIQQELYWEIITEKGSVGNFRSIPLNREKDTEKKKLEINWFDLFCSVFGC